MIRKIKSAIRVTISSYSEPLDAIQRVRALHKPEIYYEGCSEPGCCGDFREEEVCIECGTYYPCPTIKALDGEQDEQ
jgi:hypothetical protein